MVLFSGFIANSLLDIFICMSPRHLKHSVSKHLIYHIVPMPVSVIHVQGISTYLAVRTRILTLPFLLFVPAPPIQSIAKFHWSPSNRCKKPIIFSSISPPLSWSKLLVHSRKTVWQHHNRSPFQAEAHPHYRIKDLKVITFDLFFSTALFISIECSKTTSIC